MESCGVDWSSDRSFNGVYTEDVTPLLGNVKTWVGLYVTENGFGTTRRGCRMWAPICCKERTRASCVAQLFFSDRISYGRKWVTRGMWLLTCSYQIR